VGAIFFEKHWKSGIRTITWDTQESGNKRTCEVQRDPKFLVAFSNENLFGYPAAKGHFLGMSAYLKISVHPQLRFLRRHRYRKLIKAEGLFLVKLRRMSIQDSSGCCTFQMSLVYNQVCWGFVWCGYGTFQFWKMSLAALAIFRGIFLGPGGCAGWFLRGFGVRGARGGSFGVTKPKRDILVAV